MFIIGLIIGTATILASIPDMPNIVLTKAGSMAMKLCTHVRALLRTLVMRLLMNSDTRHWVLIRVVKWNRKLETGTKPLLFFKK